MAKKTTASGQKMSADDIFSKYAANTSDTFIPLDVECLNELWGGGLNLGTMYSFWGEPGTGKSTLTFQVIKSLLKQGLKVLFVDVEKALNVNQQITFGLKQFIDEGLLIHTTIQDYVDLQQIINAATTSGITCMVVDSETQILPAMDEEISVADVRPGLKARQSGNVMTLCKNKFYNEKIASIWIFQARANIQIGGMPAYGAPAFKQAGGMSAIHIPDVITKLSTKSKVKEGDSVIGVNLHIVCEKNKFTSPNVVKEKKLIYGVGISKRVDTVDKAISMGIIQQGGAGYFTLPDGTRHRGLQTLYKLPGEVLTDLAKRIKEA